MKSSVMNILTSVMRLVLVMVTSYIVLQSDEHA